MENPGERLVGDFLRHIKGCDFVDFNVYTKRTQGEIDVVGLNHEKKEAFICEVVTHLITGIRYVKNGQDVSTDRLIKKFLEDIEYGKGAFAGYAVHYMLWAPVVRHSEGKPEYNQQLTSVEAKVKAETGIQIILVVNRDYINAIKALRDFARDETKELKSPIMRFLQIEEWSRKNLTRGSNKPKDPTA